jgi:hypothetical protein
MKHLLCAALSALLAVAAAGGAPQQASAQDCATVENVTEQIRRGAPDADIRVIAGAAASRLRSGISSLVDQIVPEGGTYLIARMPDVPVSYVVRFVDGCATHHGRFPDRLLRSWIDGNPA